MPGRRWPCGRGVGAGRGGGGRGGGQRDPGERRNGGEERGAAQRMTSHADHAPAPDGGESLLPGWCHPRGWEVVSGVWRAGRGQFRSTGPALISARAQGRPRPRAGAFVMRSLPPGTKIGVRVARPRPCLRAGSARLPGVLVRFPSHYPPGGLEVRMPRPLWTGAISFGLVTSLNYCRSIRRCSHGPGTAGSQPTSPRTWGRSSAR